MGEPDEWKLNEAPYLNSEDQEQESSGEQESPILRRPQLVRSQEELEDKWYQNNPDLFVVEEKSGESGSAEDREEASSSGSSTKSSSSTANDGDDSETDLQLLTDVKALIKSLKLENEDEYKDVENKEPKELELLLEK